MKISPYALRLQTPSPMAIDWLVVGLASALALHAAHLPLWVTAGMAMLLAWRFAASRKRWQPPSFWLLLPLTLIGIGGILAQYHSLFGRDASVALLTLMLGLKLLESRNSRDFTLVVFLGYFLTVNAFLFTQSIAIAAAMLLPLLMLTLALSGISLPEAKPMQWQKQLRLAGTLLLQAIPLMLIFFLLFPRLPGPLWGVPKDAYSSMTGLSDSMSPGNISSLSLSGAIAFRVAFAGKSPSQDQLYWRGPIFDFFDGRSWRASAIDESLPRESLEISGEARRYAITLEPHNRHWMLMLDMPAELPANTNISPHLQVLAREPVRTRIRYNGVSHLQYRLGEQLDSRAQRLALQLPRNGNNRSRELAQQWQAQFKTPSAIVNAALTQYRQQPFAYTLSPPPLGENSVDDFLFNTRRGFCEHYASSFVFLMRAAGIPARVVTGYQGGELNPVGNYLIVRQSDAHAWAEVWLEGRGWVRIDPTAAVSPSRIETGIADAVADSETLPLLARRDYPLLRKLYLNWDAVNNGWNQWVLGYDQQRQMALMQKLFGNHFSWQDMVSLLVGASIALLGGLSYWLFRMRRIRPDALQSLYGQFLNKLEKAGLRKQAQEGPWDFAQRAQHHFPHQADDIAAITQMYLQLRYGPDSTHQSIERPSPRGWSRPGLPSSIKMLAFRIRRFKAQ